MVTPLITFTDKKYRTIEIGGDGDEVIAYHNGKEVGRLVIDDNGHIFLAQMLIDQEYQRAGIGTEMIKLAEEWFNDFNIVDHLSLEGAAFLNYCVDNHIFKFKHSKTTDDRY